MSVLEPTHLKVWAICEGPTSSGDNMNRMVSFQMLNTSLDHVDYYRQDVKISSLSKEK